MPRSRSSRRKAGTALSSTAEIRRTASAVSARSSFLDEPEVYGLPPDPVVPTRHLKEMWRTTALAAAATVVAAAFAFLGGGE
jgi:hypothetical protein